MNDPALHECCDCSYALDAKYSELLDNIPTLEFKVAGETKNNVFLITGFIVRKKDPLPDDTRYYADTYVQPGRLSILYLARWCTLIKVFVFFLYGLRKQKVSRNSSTWNFQHISDSDVLHPHSWKFSRDFLAKLCRAFAPLQRKDIEQKVIEMCFRILT